MASFWWERVVRRFSGGGGQKPRPSLSSSSSSVACLTPIASHLSSPTSTTTNVGRGVSFIIIKDATNHHGNLVSSPISVLDFGTAAATTATTTTMTAAAAGDNEPTLSNNNKNEIPNQHSAGNTDQPQPPPTTRTTSITTAATTTTTTVWSLDAECERLAVDYDEASSTCCTVSASLHATIPRIESGGADPAAPAVSVNDQDSTTAAPEHNPTNDGNCMNPFMNDLEQANNNDRASQIGDRLNDNSMTHADIPIGADNESISGRNSLPPILDTDICTVLLVGTDMGSEIASTMPEDGDDATRTLANGQQASLSPVIQPSKVINQQQHTTNKRANRSPPPMDPMTALVQCDDVSTNQITSHVYAAVHSNHQDMEAVAPTAKMNPMIRPATPPIKSYLNAADEQMGLECEVHMQKAESICSATARSDSTPKVTISANRTDLDSSCTCISETIPIPGNAFSPSTKGDDRVQPLAEAVVETQGSVLPPSNVAVGPPSAAPLSTVAPFTKEAVHFASASNASAVKSPRQTSLPLLRMVRKLSPRMTNTSNRDLKLTSEHHGRSVKIIKGKYKGKLATILDWKMKGTYLVQLQDGSTIGVRASSVQDNDSSCGDDTDSHVHDHAMPDGCDAVISSNVPPVLKPDQTQSVMDSFKSTHSGSSQVAPMSTTNGNKQANSNNAPVESPTLPSKSMDDATISQVSSSLFKNANDKRDEKKSWFGPGITISSPLVESPVHLQYQILSVTPASIESVTSASNMKGSNVLIDPICEASLSGVRDTKGGFSISKSPKQSLPLWNAAFQTISSRQTRTPNSKPHGHETGPHSTAEQNSTNDPQSPLPMEHRVKIAQGRYRGKSAIILGWKSKGTYLLRLQDGTTIGVRSSSVEGDSANPSQSNAITDPGIVPETTASHGRVDHQQSNREPAELNRRELGRDSSTFNKHAVDPPDPWLNQPVLLCAGARKGKKGLVVGKTNKTTYEVLLEDNIIVGTRSSSLQKLSRTMQNDTAVDPLLRISTADENPRTQLRSLNNFQRTIAVRKTQAQVSNEDNSGNSWRVADHSVGGKYIGSQRIQCIRIEDDTSKSEISFLSHLLGNRMLCLDKPLNGRQNQSNFDKSFHADGARYELISTKINEDKEKGSLYTPPKVMRLVYAQVGGPGLVPISLAEVLEKLGDFSVINPRKIMARLELLQSPARFNLVFVNANDVCRIPETGNVGGGFISDEMMFDICIQGGMSKSQAQLVVTIQVRLFIPCIGICKGMLMRKRIKSGPAIQVPDSMIKVPASQHSDALREDAAVVVCKNGIHPSPGSANEYLGRRFDKSRKVPPIKSFTSKIKTPLSDMVFHLWKAMGVTEATWKDYAKRSLHPENRNHAWLVGVPDPTAALPADTIFVPGMTKCTTRPQQYFVTRSPCVQYEHGRILQAVIEKPCTMLQEDWDWLNDLPFSCVIFSNPRNGRMSIPERIACGDLDGDLYLICWDQRILSQMTAVPLPDLPIEDDGILKTVEPNPNWLHVTQDLMIDAGKVNDMGKLTGKLYNLGKAKAKDCSEGLKHPDAAAFFEAYNQALEFKKHGCDICLPLHLHGAIPGPLRRYLTTTPAPQDNTVSKQSPQPMLLLPLPTGNHERLDLPFSPADSQLQTTNEGMLSCR